MIVSTTHLRRWIPSGAEHCGKDWKWIRRGRQTDILQRWGRARKPVPECSSCITSFKNVEQSLTQWASHRFITKAGPSERIGLNEAPVHGNYNAHKSRAIRHSTSSYCCEQQNSNAATWSLLIGCRVTWPANRPMGELSRLEKLEKIGKNVQNIGALDVKSHTKFQPNILIFSDRFHFSKF